MQFYGRFSQTLLFASSLLCACSVTGQWNIEHGETTASLRGIHNAGAGVVWASGANGTVRRTEDAGFVWQECATPAGGEKLDFRGVWAWDANHAIVMSSGPGDASRIFETSDGCSHWGILFTNPDPQGFFDAMVFLDRRRGVILGDPVNGRFTIWWTSDGGHHWTRDVRSGLEVGPNGESAFAASNSAITFPSDGVVVFGSGGPGGPRVFRFQNNRWTTVRAPLAGQSETAGVFSIAFRDSLHGLVVGGDFKKPDERNGTAAWTSDGGVTWNASSTMPSGYRSSVAWDQHSRSWITVGPNGSDLSRDDGKSWKQFDKSSWNALSLPWVVGSDGKIGALNEVALRQIMQAR
jgi:photosystem II stability/assembly factor-like uncharacterized protein